MSFQRFNVLAGFYISKELGCDKSKDKRVCCVRFSIPFYCDSKVITDQRLPKADVISSDMTGDNFLLLITPSMGESFFEVMKGLHPD